MNLISKLEQEEIERLGKTVPDFSPGDTVVVSVNVVEGQARNGMRRMTGHRRAIRGDHEGVTRPPAHARFGEFRVVVGCHEVD